MGISSNTNDHLPNFSSWNEAEDQAQNNFTSLAADESHAPSSEGDLLDGSCEDQPNPAIDIFDDAMNNWGTEANFTHLTDVNSQSPFPSIQTTPSKPQATDLSYGELLTEFTKAMGFLGDAGQVLANGSLNLDFFRDCRSFNEFRERICTMARLGESYLLGNILGSRYEALFRGPQFESLLHEVFQTLPHHQSDFGLTDAQAKPELLATTSNVSSHSINRLKWEIMFCHPQEFLAGVVRGSKEDLTDLHELFEWAFGSDIPVREQFRAFRELNRVTADYVEKELRHEVRNHLGLTNWLNFNIDETEHTGAYQGVCEVLNCLIEHRETQNSREEYYFEQSESLQVNNDESINQGSAENQAQANSNPLWHPSRRAEFSTHEISTDFALFIGEKEAIYQASLVGDDPLDVIRGCLARLAIDIADNSKWSANYQGLTEEERLKLTQMRQYLLREIEHYLSKARELNHQYLEGEIEPNQVPSSLYEFSSKVRRFLTGAIDANQLAVTNSEGQRAGFWQRASHWVFRQGGVAQSLTEYLHPYARENYDRLLHLVDGIHASWQMGERAITIRDLDINNQWLNEIDDPESKNQLQTNISNLIRSFDTIKNELWLAYRRSQPWLSRVASNTFHALGESVGDRAKIEAGIRFIDHFLVKLDEVESVASWHAFYQNFMTSLGDSLAEGGVLYEAIQASDTDLTDQLITIVGEIALCLPFFAAPRMLGVAAKSIQVAARGGRLANMATRVTTLTRVASQHRLIRLTTRLSQGKRLTQMSQAFGLGLYTNLAGNALSLDPSHDQGMWDICKTGVAAGLAASLTLGFGAPVGQAGQGVARSIVQRYSLNLAGAARLAKDISFSVSEDFTDLALQQAFDGQFLGLTSDAALDIGALSLAGGALGKTGLIIETLGQLSRRNQQPAPQRSSVNNSNNMENSLGSSANNSQAPNKTPENTQSTTSESPPTRTTDTRSVELSSPQKVAASQPKSGEQSNNQTLQPKETSGQDSTDAKPSSPNKVSDQAPKTQAQPSKAPQPSPQEVKQPQNKAKEITPSKPTNTDSTASGKVPDNNKANQTAQPSQALPKNQKNSSKPESNQANQALRASSQKNGDSSKDGDSQNRRDRGQEDATPPNREQRLSRAEKRAAKKARKQRRQNAALRQKAEAIIKAQKSEGPCIRQKLAEIAGPYLELIAKPRKLKRELEKGENGLLFRPNISFKVKDGGLTPQVIEALVALKYFPDEITHLYRSVPINHSRNRLISVKFTNSDRLVYYVLPDNKIKVHYFGNHEGYNIAISHTILSYL